MTSSPPRHRGRLRVVDDGELVLCAHCGEGHRALASHVRARHGLTAAQYRAAHDLDPRTALTAPATRHRPDRRATSARGARLAPLTEPPPGRTPTPEEAAALAAARTVAAWCALADRLLATGVLLSVVARESGFSARTARARLRQG